jgi:RNA polymerase sigma-70 factor, ECF subfamily
VDPVLIRRCQAGDEEAFAQLFHQYKNLVYRTTYLTLGSAADAEDILQEVFLQVHRSLDTYEPTKGALSTWLYRITVNRCLNWRRGRTPVDSLDDLADEWPSGVYTRLLPEAHAATDCVRRALDGLSTKLRVVVVLRHYWDLSYADIAEIAGLPLGTVKSRLNLALRLMRDSLELEFACPSRSTTEACR